MSNCIFVYGTLQPGQSRWPIMEPFTTGPDAATEAVAAGLLFDTGYGWPAAVFAAGAADPLPGVVITLRPESVDHALAVLDDVEGVDSGLFRRIPIDVEGQPCWAYHWPSPTTRFRRIARWPCTTRRPDCPDRHTEGAAPW